MDVSFEREEKRFGKELKQAGEVVREGDSRLDTIIINEVQLILAEKRTSLAAMRTGIAVFSLPLSVLSVLVATSRYYDITSVLPFLIPLLTISAALVVLGTYLVVRSAIRIHRYDDLITGFKKETRPAGRVHRLNGRACPSFSRVVIRSCMGPHLMLGR